MVPASGRSPRRPGSAPVMALTLLRADRALRPPGRWARCTRLVITSFASRAMAFRASPRLRRCGIVGSSGGSAPASPPNSSLGDFRSTQGALSFRAAAGDRVVLFAACQGFTCCNDCQTAFPWTVLLGRCCGPGPVYKPHPKTSFIHRTVRCAGISRSTVWTSIWLVRFAPGWSDLLSTVSR